MYGKPSTMLWPPLVAIALAISWILPNHHRPWRGFHQDAWIMLCLLCLGLWVLWKSKTIHAWSMSTALVVGCAAIPLFQWQSGLIATSGQAIVSSVYILACGIAIVLAQQAKQSHGNLVVNCMFAGIAIASVINVTFQLAQWFALYDENLLSFIGFFVLPISTDVRPSGNLLQPNLFATFMVWGIIAGFWGYLRRAVPLPLLALYLAYLGLGMAITQSRIGLVELLALCAAAFYWRRLWPSFKAMYGCFAVTAYIFILFFSLPSLSAWLGLEYAGRGDYAALVQDNVRLVAYRIFIDAIATHPWFGYGVSHLGNAYLEHAQTQVSQAGYFLHSHNFALDMLLWFGVPLGLLLLAACAVWLGRTLVKIASADQVALLAMVGALGLHSMVELPHQSLIFLIPAFIAIGTLNHEIAPMQVWQLSRWVTGVFVIGGLGLWAVMTHDYSLVEKHYAEWLFERENIGKPLGKPMPNLVLLNQLEFVMQLQRMEPVPGLGADQLNWMRRAVRAEVSQPAYFNYIGAMALNGEREEAVLWMYKLNAANKPRNPKPTYDAWLTLQKKYPQIADLPWAKR